MMHISYYGLEENHPHVPHEVPPLYWDPTLPVQTNLNVLEVRMGYYERLLNGNKFDEAAVQVPGSHARANFSAELKAQGWEHFNNAQDLVLANPFGVRYTVEYDFYRHPEKSYRLEVMMLLSGFSPLHQALRYQGQNSGLWPVPHLSYKPRVASGITPEMNVRWEVERLRKDHGFLLVQACQSTYGQFWYLLDGSGKQSYLKPRLNTRDSE